MDEILLVQKPWYLMIPLEIPRMVSTLVSKWCEMDFVQTPAFPGPLPPLGGPSAPPRRRSRSDPGSWRGGVRLGLGLVSGWVRLGFVRLV